MHFIVQVAAEYTYTEERMMLCLKIH